jgi:hypothetical protein
MNMPEQFFPKQLKSKRQHVVIMSGLLAMFPEKGLKKTFIALFL